MKHGFWKRLIFAFFPPPPRRIKTDEEQIADQLRQSRFDLAAQAKEKRTVVFGNDFNYLWRVAAGYVKWKMDPVDEIRLEPATKNWELFSAMFITIDGKRVAKFPRNFVKLQEFGPRIIAYVNLCAMTEAERMVGWGESEWRRRWRDMQMSSAHFVAADPAVSEPTRKRCEGKIFDEENPTGIDTFVDAGAAAGGGLASPPRGP